MKEKIKRWIAKIAFQIHCKFSHTVVIGIAITDIKNGDIVSMRDNDKLICRSLASDPFNSFKY